MVFKTASSLIFRLNKRTEVVGSVKMVSTIRSCRDSVFYFFRVLPLRSPINFRDISDIDDRRKKAFDSRPSQLDSVFITEAARDIASAYLLRRKRRERLNDSFSFPFFSSLFLFLLQTSGDVLEWRKSDGNNRGKGSLSSERLEKVPLCWWRRCNVLAEWHLNYTPPSYR